MKAEAHSPWPHGKAPDAAYCSENERLSVIASFGLEGFSADPELEDITRFAAQLCGTGMATVSLVEEERQRFLASEGLEETETARSTSFCAHTMLSGSIMEVLDATQDDRFADFSSVTGSMHLRYYAGAPLISEEGAPLGALCVFDNAIRKEPLNAVQRKGLEVLASAVMRRLQARRTRLKAESELAGSETRFRLLADSIPDIVWSTDANGKFDYFNQRWFEFVGLDERPADGWIKFFHPEDHQGWYAEWVKARESGSEYKTEYRLLSKDGTYRWMLARGLPLKDSNGVITRWFGTITDIDENYRESEARGLLAREMAHRIKNVFAVISGLLTLRARGKPELEDFSTAMDQAIRALAKAQDFVLPVRPQSEQQLIGLLELLLEPFRKSDPLAVTVDGYSLALSARSATPLALIVHELATNSTKYGALSALEGKVSVSVEDQGDEIAIIWRESGGPPVHEPSSQGFGSRLLLTTVEKQLGGKLERDWNSQGLCCTITVPKKQLHE